EVARRGPQVEAEADDLRLRRQIRQARQGSTDMMIRLPLVAEIMQRGCKEPVCHHAVDGIAGVGHDLRETMRKFEGPAEFAIVELIDAEAPKRAQQIISVLEPLGELQGCGPGGTGLPGPANTIHERPAACSR